MTALDENLRECYRQGKRDFTSGPAWQEPCLGQEWPSGMQLESCQGKDRLDTFSLHLQIITFWGIGGS